MEFEIKVTHSIELGKITWNGDMLTAWSDFDSDSDQYFEEEWLSDVTLAIIQHAWTDQEGTIFFGTEEGGQHAAFNFELDVASIHFRQFGYVDYKVQNEWGLV